jgi:hypothetical protein
MVDQVKVVADDQAPAEQSLRRNLTNRHIQLIAIGGAIGTGLFMGSGKTISLAGPSIIFVYMIIANQNSISPNIFTVARLSVNSSTITASEATQSERSGNQN